MVLLWRRRPSSRAVSCTLAGAAAVRPEVGFGGVGCALRFWPSRGFFCSSSSEFGPRVVFLLTFYL